MDAIFADSLTSKARTSAYTTKYVLENIAGAVGPAISIVLYAVLGNTWLVMTVARVMMAGVVLMAVPVFAMFLYDADYCLGAESEAVTDAADDSGMHRGILQVASVCGMPSDRAVRVLMWSNEFIISLGAGMVIKFFGQYGVFQSSNMTNQRQLKRSGFCRTLGCSRSCCLWRS